MAKYHISPKTNKPSLCSTNSCPFGEEAPHFSNIQTANKHIESKLSEQYDTIKTHKKREILKIPTDFGEITLENGNLNKIETRRALINGLCGDLAKAVHKETGNDIYFVCHDYKDSESFIKAFQSDPNTIYTTVDHAMVESNTKGKFMDAYGQKSESDITSFYGEDITLLKGTPEMLETFSTGVSEKLDKFAKSVIELDNHNKSYDYKQYE